MVRGGIIAWLTVRIMLREGRNTDSVIAELTEAEGRPPTPGEAAREVLRRQYLWTDARGVRRIGWRVWVLLWLSPALFALATLFLTVEAVVKTRFYAQTEAEVVRVYSWEDETGVSPLFRYTWIDGKPTEATPGVRHEDWDFPVGSVHTILYNPWRKTNVVLPGAHNWFVARVIAAITIVTALVSGYVTLRLLRWRAKGETG
jgi:hypothetical protein